MSVNDTARAGATERGAILPLMAIVLVVLMGAAAMAVDLGWLFWQSIEIQHGADAAALAGVAYEPDRRTEAHTEATAAAFTNGYDDASSGTTVAVVDYVDDNTAVDHDGQMRVTITHQVNTFFLKVFGLNDVDIARTAVAEYVLPLPMGSPEPYFGNDPALGRWPNFWGNIHGYYTPMAYGDRFSSQCIGNTSFSGCEKNDERRESVDEGTQQAAGGYLYGIEVDPGAVGSILTVELFDPHHTRGGGDNVLVGDNIWPLGSSGATTTFMLYGPDPTPLLTTDGNALECSVSYDPRDPYADFNGDGIASDSDDQDGDGDLDWDDVELAYPGGVDALWEPFCTVPIVESGIFPLRIMVNDPGTDDERALNRWSIRASTSSDQQPTVFGLGDMAIFANVDGALGNTEFHLAEVKEVHAGKTLVVELWDPGDASGDHSVEIRHPGGTAPPCTWTAERGGGPPAFDDTGPGTASGTEASCVIDTSVPGGGRRFSNWLVTIEIELPDGYTCDVDCWWTIYYNYPGNTLDTTTWSAYIGGQPIHLVE